MSNRTGNPRKRTYPRQGKRPARFGSGLASLPASTPGDAKGLPAAMRRYLEHLGIKGYTETGRLTAERYIREFIQWADARGVTHPQEVSRAVLERYQRWNYYYRKKDGAPLSVASQRGKLIPLRGFFKWLTRNAEIPANPASDLDLPRRQKRLPHAVLTAAEVERVLAEADLSTPIGLRDRAMMEVLYATGIRRFEIARLEIGDIDAERAVVLVRLGKWGKDRLIPLGLRALHWVQVYLDRGRPELAWDSEERGLFLGAEGRTLRPSWLSTTVAGYVRRAAIGKQGGCHLFRHTMATLMLEGGADIRFIQAILGHAELSTTQIYTQVAIRQLCQVHAMTHPGVFLRGSAPEASPTLPEAEIQPGADTLQATRLQEALAAEAEEEAADLSADSSAGALAKAGA